MIDTAPELCAAVDTHHDPRCRIFTSDGQDWTDRLIRGTITKSSGLAPRSRISLTIGEAGVPRLIDQGMLPTGRDVQVLWRVHPMPYEILVAAGRLVANPLERPESTWSPDVPDWSAVIAVDDTHPAQWAAVPATVADLVTQVVHRTLPATVLDITGPALTAPLPPFMRMDGDPWQLIETAVRSCGSEAWFRPDGECVVRAEPDLAAQPVDRLMVGPQGGITGYRLEHEAAYSGVHLHYRSSDGAVPDVVGTWYDNRPDSPTSVARIGRAVLRQDAEDGPMPSQAQADAAAAALAPLASGRARRAVVRHVPRPWIEPGDTVMVVFSGGPSELHLVESVEIPIGPGVQVTTLRNHAYKIEPEVP